jgi:hypothetical protein
LLELPLHTLKILCRRFFAVTPTLKLNSDVLDRLAILIRLLANALQLTPQFITLLFEALFLGR